MKSLSSTITVFALISVTVAATYVCTARAGRLSHAAVRIDTVGRVASGAFGPTRNQQDDTTEYIYCHVNATTTALSAGCVAHDAVHGTVSCTTTNHTLISIIQEATTDSFVDFHWDTRNVCSNVQVTENSETDPKAL